MKVCCFFLLFFCIFLNLRFYPILKRVQPNSNQDNQTSSTSIGDKKDEKVKFNVKDELEINENFDSKTIRVKINPQLNKKKGEDSQQQKATKQKVSTFDQCQC